MQVLMSVLIVASIDNKNLMVISIAMASVDVLVYRESVFPMGFQRKHVFPFL